MTLKDPPDPGSTTQTIPSNPPKMLECSFQGPKFLLMTRVNATNDETLLNVSPFLIKKVIDGSCSGEVEMCKKTRNGCILIKTKNFNQAQKIMQIKSLSQAIAVEVTEHRSLNFTKGVIYSNDLRDIPVEEIQAEMKSQHVSEVKKIFKKTANSLVETGLVILTFSKLTLPNEVFIGYERVHVRPFIPSPLRCNNCFKYGHTAKFCKNEKICNNCSKKFHTDIEKQEVCQNTPTCVNCKESKLNQDNHSATSKLCPIFIKKQEIQSIKTTQNVDMKTAVSIYNSRHQQPELFSSIVASPPVSIPKVQLQKKENQISIPSRKTTSYSDVITESDSELSINSPTVSSKQDTSASKNVKIFPRSLSQRTRNQLKSKSKGKITNSAPQSKRTYISNTKEYSFDEEEGMELL